MHGSFSALLRAARVSRALGIGALWWCAAGLAQGALFGSSKPPQPERPNIVVILADDLGYGDLGCYGAKRIKTPHCDRLAARGLRFTDAHSSASTGSASRLGLLTGEHGWRRKVFTELRPNAPLAINLERETLPALLRRSGYRTGWVGVWHLGLGLPKEDLDWNAEIKPGPREAGFDHSFFLPGPPDAMPCVFVENGRVVGLQPADPMTVSGLRPIPGHPMTRPPVKEMKLLSSLGHNQSFLHGIGRNGYVSGGQSALWRDEAIAETLVTQAVAFVEREKEKPFFLCLATHDIHVPRVPAARFAGKSELGPRGDAILQFDWTVGEIMACLERLDLVKRTLVIVTSDNGPVVEDGYRDLSASKLGDHRPAGPWRGGKNTAFEGGTRVPLILHWPGRVKTGVSPALVCHLDFLASFAALIGEELPVGAGADSFDLLPAFLGRTKEGRSHLVEQGDVLALRQDEWKFILAGRPAKKSETNNAPEGWLFRLDRDPGETNNLAAAHTNQLATMLERLLTLRDSSSAR